MATGAQSFCYIELDGDSIVKMDQESGIRIARLDDRLLRVVVERGQMMAQARNQAAGHALEAVAGNTVVSVRGTMIRRRSGIFQARRKESGLICRTGLHRGGSGRCSMKVSAPTLCWRTDGFTPGVSSCRKLQASAPPCGWNSRREPRVARMRGET